MKRVNYNLLFKGLLILCLTFIGGFFLPNSLLTDNLKMFEMLFASFGVSLTLFTFIQGIVQNCKSSFLISVKKSKEYLLDKFKGLDNIVKELQEDVLGLLIFTSLFGLVALFFGHIENEVFQEILSYIKYFVLFVAFFLILDLVLSMFKLIQINSELNKIAAMDREN